MFNGLIGVVDSAAGDWATGEVIEIPACDCGIRTRALVLEASEPNVCMICGSDDSYTC